MNYSEKLRNPLWQKKRLEILNRDNFTCSLCCDEKTELHIHHKKYKRGKEPWEYQDDDFQTLCKHCHAITERVKKFATPKIVTKRYDDAIELLVLTVSIVSSIGICVQIYTYSNDNKLEYVNEINEDEASLHFSLINITKHLIQTYGKGSGISFL